VQQQPSERSVSIAYTNTLTVKFIEVQELEQDRYLYDVSISLGHASSYSANAHFADQLD
jgi:hypothetical protein